MFGFASPSIINNPLRISNLFNVTDASIGNSHALYIVQNGTVTNVYGSGSNGVR